MARTISIGVQGFEEIRKGGNLGARWHPLVRSYEALKL